MAAFRLEQSPPPVKIPTLIKAAPKKNEVQEESRNLAQMLRPFLIEIVHPARLGSSSQKIP
jgi:hypothetical protein